MDVTRTEEPNATRVVISGEVDADNCADMGKAVLGGSDAVDKILLDLSQLTFIDSSGLGELLRIGEAADERGQSVEILNPSPAVLRILEMTGLLDHFGLTKAT